MAGCDKRSRLPDAVDLLLRVPALTPKALAACLKLAPQTGTALLRELAGRGFAQEITGRGSFRAFTTSMSRCDTKGIHNPGRGCRTLAPRAVD